MKNAVNVKKLEEYASKYEQAKKLADKYLYDTEYVIQIVDLLISKGVLSNVDKNDETIFNKDTDNYTPHYAMFIWRECVLPVIGITYDQYRAIEALHKMSKSL